MKSKITKIQILKKGIAILLASMFMLTPIAYGVTSLDDSYLESSFLDQLLYGKIGSTAKEIEEYFKSGETTLYIINETQLRALAEYVNNGHDCDKKEIILLNDIELINQEEWVPIGRGENNCFKGTFNGNGKKITGINITNNNKGYIDRNNIGLFGYTYQATIKNLTISKSNYSLYGEEVYEDDYPMWGNIGAVVGYCRESIIENCIVDSDVSVSGNGWVGGIVGMNYSGEAISTIKNCISKANVRGYVHVGGIAGLNYGCDKNNWIDNKYLTFTGISAQILNCTNEGTVYAKDGCVGGIVGGNYKSAIVQKCHNKGQVGMSTHEEIVDGRAMQPQNAGGIAGWSSGGVNGETLLYSAIDACINDGKIYGYRDVGGLVGQLGSSTGGYGILKGSINYSLDVTATFAITECGYIAGEVGISSDIVEALNDGTKESCGILSYNFYNLGDSIRTLSINKNNNTATVQKLEESISNDEIRLKGFVTAPTIVSAQTCEYMKPGEYLKGNAGVLSYYLNDMSSNVNMNETLSYYEISYPQNEGGGEYNIILGYGRVNANTTGMPNGLKFGTGIILQDENNKYYALLANSKPAKPGETVYDYYTKDLSEYDFSKSYFANLDVNIDDTDIYYLNPILIEDEQDNKNNYIEGSGDNSKDVLISSTKNNFIYDANSERWEIASETVEDLNINNIEGNTLKTKSIKLNSSPELNVTYEIQGYRKINNSDQPITLSNGCLYLKADDTLKVTATFDKRLYTVLGTSNIAVSSATAPKLTMEINGEFVEFNIDENNIPEIIGNTTIINYVKTVTEKMVNGKATQLKLNSSTIYYAIEGNFPQDTTTYQNYRVNSIDNTVDLSNYNIINIDTVKPIINTKVYVENMLKTERYTAGKEILFEVKTSETIQGSYEVPQIQVSFSESGVGKYNYTKEKGEGFAKCTEAKINLDGTTTWIYSYQIQERDEGELEFTYTAGKITDLAGNETDINELYTPSTKEPSKPITGTQWNNNLGVTYKFYKNEVKEENKITSQTYFTDTDDLIVVATYDKVLYVLYANVNKENKCIPFSSTYLANLPSLYLNGESNIKSLATSISEKNEIKESKQTKVTYKFEAIAKNEYLDELTLLSKVVVKNENNTTTISAGGGDYVLGGQILYSTEYYDEYKDEYKENLQIVQKGYTKTTEGLDDILIDPIGVSTKIEKSNIYADTTAPTVTITADKSNPTNANSIKYTFKFSEVVEGFTADDITVNGGEQVKVRVGEGEEAVEQPKFVEVTEGLEYTLEVKPTITDGNEGVLQVIVEEGAVKDLVAINNVRQESNIIIDKVRPTFTSYEIKEESGKVIIDLTFSEALSDASELKPTLKVGGKDARGTWEDKGIGEIYDNNKVEFIYNVSGADGGKVEVTLAGTVKDSAGNDSEKLNISAENEIILEQEVIKNGDDIYSFYKNNKPINDFTNPTYFVKGNTIKVEKINQETDEKGNIVEVTTTYSPYVIEEDLDLTPMKYMKIVKVEEDTDGSGKIEDDEIKYVPNFFSTEQSESIDILEANIWFDTVAPKVTTEITANNPTANNVYGEGSELTIKATTSESIQDEYTTEAPVINIKFGENVGNFNSGKAEYVETIKNEDGTTTWVYRYLVSVGDEGGVSLRYVSGRIKDLAGNTVTNITTLNSEEDVFVLNNIVADTTIPTVEITLDKSNPTNADKIVYTFEFSEVVDGFTVEDITVNNANRGKFVEVTKGSKYTLEIEPVITSGNEGDVQVIVEQNACIDKVGLGNVRAENIIKVDKKAPTVEIKANKENVSNGDVITYEFIWSESVKEFTAADITVTNGTKGTFTGEGNYYTLEVTAKNGNDVEVLVAADVAKDNAGNNNIASSKHVIAVAPSVTIKTNVTNPTNKSEITYTFEWSEPVTGFDISDIILPNGVEGTLSGNTMTIDYNGVIALGNEGEVTVAVKENAAQDANGNQNAYASNTTKIDRIAPIFIGLESYAESTIKLDSNVDTVKQYYKAGDKVIIVATFTENVEKSTAPTLALQFSESGNALGTVSAGTIEGNKITYTYEITYLDEIQKGDNGTLSVKGFSGEVVDTAGNKTTVTKRELTGDTIIADTIKPELIGITAIAPDFEYDELLQDGETKRYGVTSKTRDNNKITIIAEYSENVYSLNSNTINKITDVPDLSIKFGTGSTRIIKAGSVEGNKIIYTYNIQSGDNGNLSVVSLNGTVSDIAGNTLTTNTSLPTLAKYEVDVAEENKVDNITADTIRTSISSINATTSTSVNYDDNGNKITGNGSYYRKGAVITITATTNEYVYKFAEKSLVRFEADTAPDLNVSFATSGTSKGKAVCTNVEYKDNKTVFTYTYTVQENDNGQLSLNIVENVGYDIALNGNYVKSETKSIYADTVNPVTNWQSWVESEGYGIVDNLNGTWEVTFSEKLYVYDNVKYQVKEALSNSHKNQEGVVPKLLVSKDNTTVLETDITDITTKTINGLEKTVITYKYADYTKNIGAYGMKFASVSDKAGNLFNLKDQVAPTLSSIKVTNPATGTYKAGEVITIVATFSEKLNESSNAPTLALKFSKSGDAKGTVSAGVITANTITYTYIITAEDNKGNGDNGLLQIKSFTGTGLLDLSDNEWIAPETVTLSGNTITADTISPVITKLEAKVDDKVIGSYEQSPETYVAGRTNADTINYVITFSEKVTLINKEAIEITNGKITEVSHKDNTVTVTVKTTTEGVQSLIIPAETVADMAQVGGNKNEFFRFNGITVDFTKPTVRFISEYNGGVYVLPTSIEKVEIRPNVEINEDISKIEYKWDNEEYAVIEKYSGASDIVVPTKEFTKAGEYTLYIRVIDVAGNVTVASKEYTVKASQINLVPSETKPTNQDVLVTVEFEDGLTDNRKVAFKAEGSNEYKEIVPETDGYRITENGTVYAEATDKVGNKVYNELLIDNIDKVAPEVKLDLYSANLVIGTGKDKATIKTGLEVKDENSVEIKYIYSNNEAITDEEKVAMKSLNNYGEAKIEDAVEGTYYLHVIAVDSAGNETVVKSSEFVVANSNTVKDEEGNVTFTPAVENTITFTREQQFVDVNFGMNLTENQDITFTNEDDGYALDGYAQVLKPTTVTAKASDICGNTVIATYVVESVEGPEFEVTGNPKNWTNQDVKLEVVSYDELKALTVNGTDILNNKEYVVTANGDYEFIATDIFGNISKQTIKVTKIDKVVPVISKVENAGKDITITATDELSGVKQYAITLTTEVPVEWSESNVIKTTKDGTFYVWAKDNAGNVVRAENTITVDTTAPTITFNYNSLTVTQGQLLETNVVTNEDAIISYSWDNKEWVNSEEYIANLKVTKESATAGKYTVYVKVKDKAGNESKVQTLEFNVIEEIKDIKTPEIIFEDLPTIQVDGVQYVKVSTNMTMENITEKMDKEALLGKTPEYKKLTEDNKLKTGSEITINGKTKYVIVVNGDVNCDGKVDFLGDVILANNSRIGVVNLNTIQKLAADINNSGAIEFIPDIIAMNNYRLGIINSL